MGTAFVQNGSAQDNGVTPGYYELEATIPPGGGIVRVLQRTDILFRGRSIEPLTKETGTLFMLELLIRREDMLVTGACPLRLLEWSDLTLPSSQPGEDMVFVVQNRGTEPVTWRAKFHGFGMLAPQVPHPGAGGSD